MKNFHKIAQQIRSAYEIPRAYDYFLLRKKYFNHTVRNLVYILDSIDQTSHRHSENVVRYAAQIGMALRLDKSEILKLKIAALMHDLGKYRIDRELLRKPGKLTKREWKEIKKHPITSARIVRETGILKDISDIVKHHHERFDGGGYPDPRKKGNEIPLDSRIISVADSYEAMTSKRPYRVKMSPKQAMRELARCAGTQFDPKIVSAFV